MEEETLKEEEEGHEETLEVEERSRRGKRRHRRRERSRRRRNFKQLVFSFSFSRCFQHPPSFSPPLLLSIATICLFVKQQVVWVISFSQSGRAIVGF